MSSLSRASWGLAATSSLVAREEKYPCLWVLCSLFCTILEEDTWCGTLEYLLNWNDHEDGLEWRDESGLHWGSVLWAYELLVRNLPSRLPHLVRPTEAYSARMGTTWSIYVGAILWWFLGWNYLDTTRGSLVCSKTGVWNGFREQRSNDRGKLLNLFSSFWILISRNLISTSNALLSPGPDLQGAEIQALSESTLAWIQNTIGSRPCSGGCLAPRLCPVTCVCARSCPGSATSSACWILLHRNYLIKVSVFCICAWSCVFVSPGKVTASIGSSFLWGLEMVVYPRSPAGSLYCLP